MGRSIKYTIVFLLLGLCAAPILLLQAISADQASVQTSTAVDSHSVAKVKRILKQLDYAAYFKRQWPLRITEDDLNAGLALAARGIKRIQGRAHLSASDGATLKLSLHAPENPFGPFINARLQLAANSKGLIFKQLSIGKVSFNQPITQRIIEFALVQLLGKQQSRQLLDSVKGIQTNNNSMVIQYQPLPDLARIVAGGLNQSGLFGANINTLGSTESIQGYYKQLCQQYQSSNNRNLGHYLATLFSSASQRSKNPQQAVQENQAALIATAIFFGSYKFNTLLNNVISDNEINHCQKHSPVSYLARRQDLSLHFIYSAMFKILSDHDISFAIGEFKELSDALSGGSGFSFADLAADQAGIMFATTATLPGSALQLQKANLNKEMTFFPAITDLPENITQMDFERRYGGVDGNAYNEQLEKIGDRIKRLPLYQKIQ